jgi:hypothetical protein
LATRRAQRWRGRSARIIASPHDRPDCPDPHQVGHHRARILLVHPVAGVDSVQMLRKAPRSPKRRPQRPRRAGMKFGRAKGRLRGKQLNRVSPDRVAVQTTNLNNLTKTVATGCPLQSGDLELPCTASSDLHRSRIPTGGSGQSKGLWRSWARLYRRRTGEFTTQIGSRVILAATRSPQSGRKPQWRRRSACIVAIVRRTDRWPHFGAPPLTGPAHAGRSRIQRIAT